MTTRNPVHQDLVRSGRVTQDLARRGLVAREHAGQTPARAARGSGPSNRPPGPNSLPPAVVGGRTADATGVGAALAAGSGRRSRGWRLVCGLALCGLLWSGGTGLADAAISRPAAGPPPTAGLTAALGVVKAAGYTPADTSGYDPQRTLSVIIGILTGSADGHPQQAFFFHDGRYVGVDAGVASASESWVWSTDDTVALQYQLYRPDDPMCCPTGGAATARFEWRGTRVAPADPLPSADWNAPLSRR